MQAVNSLTEIASLNGRSSAFIPHDSTLPPEADVLTIAEMQARVTALRERALILESVPGSGYHDDDHDFIHPGKFRCPQKNGWPRFSDNLVSFFGEDAIVFIGDHAHSAFAALVAWHADNRNREPWDLATNGTELKMVRYIPKLAIAYDSSVPVLSLRRDRWNDYLYVLHKMKVGLTGTPLTRSPHGS
jgi:hypothetical protein